MKFLLYFYFILILLQNKLVKSANNTNYIERKNINCPSRNDIAISPSFIKNNDDGFEENDIVYFTGRKYFIISSKYDAKRY